MKKKKLISFDLDNTLIDPTYTTFVWEIGIPQHYAKKHNITISEATPIVIAEYEKIDDSSLEWYDITYWFKYFELPGRWENLLETHRDKIDKDSAFEVFRPHKMAIPLGVIIAVGWVALSVIRVGVDFYQDITVLHYRVEQLEKSDKDKEARLRLVERFGK